jgi:hypothetical protein
MPALIAAAPCRNCRLFMFEPRMTRI